MRSLRKSGAAPTATTMHQPGKIRILNPRDLNENGIRAGFSLRHGGVSPKPYHSLNLGLSTGDDAENVHENRRLLFEHAGLPPSRLAVAGQVHGNQVLTVGEPGLYSGFDALVTADRDVVLCITSADCAVVLLADVHAGVVAACHSGWRGTVEKAVVHTASAMERMGARAARMRAYVSPCICTEHFEVGPEVAAKFDDGYVVHRADWPRPHVDLKTAVGDQLVGCGLDRASIETSPRCTVAETHDFYSHRAETGTTGRMMGYISLV